MGQNIVLSTDPLIETFPISFVYNGTSTFFFFSFSTPFFVGQRVYSLTATSGPDSVVIDMPYSCERAPVPIFKEIGFFSEKFEYCFLVENIVKLIDSPVCALDPATWGLGAGYFIDFKTYCIPIIPPNNFNSNTNLKLDCSFSSGTNRAFDFVVPYIQEVQQFVSIQYWPTSQKITSKYSLALNYKKTLDLPLQLSSGSIFNFINTPVYGNPINATSKGVFDIGPFTNGPMEIHAYASQNYKLYSQTAFIIDIINPSILQQLRVFNVAEQITLPGFLSGVFMVVFQNKNLYSGMVPQLAQLPFQTQDITYSPPYYLDDGSYGVISGTSKSFSLQYNLANSKYDIRSIVRLNLYGNIPQYVYTTPSSLDLSPPIVTNLQVIPMPVGFNRYFNIRFSVVDDKSGFKMMYFDPDSVDAVPTVVFTNSLAQGSYLDGTYEVLLDSSLYYSPRFWAVDYASYDSEYGLASPSTLESLKSMVASNPKSLQGAYCLNDFTSISWSHNHIDVSSISYSTRLLVNVSNADKLFSPSLAFVGYDYLPLETFYGYWNETYQQYLIIVKLPLRAFTGVVKYNLYMKCREQAFDSTFLNSLFPSSELRVFSNDADMFGPEISKLVQIPGQTAIISAGGTNIGWKLDIYDRLNGFEFGNITIVSDADLTEYTFVLDPNNQTQDISIKI
ncbi:hypothetical protein CYY_007965, partial [Polysphondylium violaceum]